MSAGNRNNAADPRTASSLLLEDQHRIPIEASVAKHFRTAWRVREFKDMDAFASHPAAILSDGATPVFVKLSKAAHALDQFEVEVAGLQTLSELAGIMTPTVIGLVPVADGALLILEGLQAVRRSSEHWREIGRTLARIHRIKGNYCGYARQGYFGPLYQDNRPAQNWVDFYRERRLWPRLVGAIDSGNLSSETIQMVERLIARIPNLSIPETEPCLLHGDAQQNNFITTARGIVVIDPAVYYGDPEIDLASIDYFQPVPEDVFSGYRELMPIDPGFAERRDLWRIPSYLAAVAVEGDEYLGKLTESLRKYL